MGNSIYHQRLQIHAHKTSKQHIPYTHIMLSWISDILDQQARLLESKGYGLIVPIVSINAVLLGIFADIHTWQDAATQIKNGIFSLIGLAVAIMGAIKMYIGMMQQIKKYRKGKDIKEDDEKENVA